MRIFSASFWLPVFFFLLVLFSFFFVCWPHVDTKPDFSRIKDGTFDDLTLAKEVWHCWGMHVVLHTLAILKLQIGFLIGCTKRPVSCLFNTPVSFYQRKKRLRIKSWGDAWSPSGTTRPKKVRYSEESAESAGRENQKSVQVMQVYREQIKDMKGKQSIQIWQNSTKQMPTPQECHAHPRTTAENVKLTEQALRPGVFSFSELSFALRSRAKYSVEL